MCLAVPGKVVKIFEDNGLLMGHVDFSGTINVTCMAYVPEIKLGEYVIVHAGFAISVLNEEEAREVFKTWDEFGERVQAMNARDKNNDEISEDLN